MFWLMNQQGCNLLLSLVCISYYDSFKLDNGVQMSLIINSKIKYLL